MVNNSIDYFDWHEIRGFERSDYRINKNGDVINLSKMHLLPGTVTPLGYKVVQLRLNHKIKSVFVHRLMAETFLDNPDNLPVVNHIDENKLNNRIDNLEWTSYEQNINHGTAILRSSFSRSRGIYELDQYGNRIRWYASVKYLCEIIGFPYSNSSRPSSLYRAIDNGKIWNDMILVWDDK